MLEVTCEQCGNRYNVKEERVPPQGARIKCPTCSHIILVRPSKPAEEPRAASLLSESKDEPIDIKQDEEDIAWRVRNSGMTFTFHDLPSLQAWMSNRASLNDVKVAKGEDEFKELGDYEGVMTIDLINKFFPLGDVPKTASEKDNKPAISATPSVDIPASPVMTSTTPSTSMFGVENVSKTTMRNIQKARNEENKRAQEANNKLKVFLVALVMLVCVGFALNQFGVLDGIFPKSQQIPVGYHLEVIDGVETIVSDDAAPVVEDEPQDVVDKPVAAGDNAEPLPLPSTVPEEAVDPNAAAISEEEAQAIVAAEIEKILKQAREQVKKRNWPVAQTILLSLTKEHPDNIEAKELLAKTYRALGQSEKAEQLEADIRDMKKWK